MILAQTKQTRNAAHDIADVYERLFPGRCKVYVSPDVAALGSQSISSGPCQANAVGRPIHDPPSSPPPSLRVETTDAFVQGNYRTLVVVGRLIDDFDHAPVSVVCIARNVRPESRVLFSQFVGRAVRKPRTEDPPLTAKLNTHQIYKQAENFFEWYDPDNGKENVQVDGE